MKTLHLFGAAALAAVSVQSASAQSADTEIHHLAVHYSQADTSTSRGAEATVRLVRQAARDVCAPVADPRDFQATADYQACLRKASDQAVKDIGSAAVAAAYRGMPQPQVLARR
jgi:UrcA family protein